MAGRWAQARIFEPKVDKGKKKVFFTVAYPYLSGELHVGHARTYTIVDVVSRFRRMQGYNVLFPMAWHVTGAPIIGICERIKNKDPETIRVYREIYNVPEETLAKFTDPVAVVEYFKKRAKETFIRAGFGIDWTREFVTTELNPTYDRFIQWQFRKLKEKGYVVKGSHRVRFCTHDNQAVGDHDLMEGEEATILDYSLEKFKFGEYFLPAATLRPETVLGVVNMWLNPEAVYVKAKVDSEKWIVSKQAAEKLKAQDHKVEIEKEFKGKELIGKKCTVPLAEREVIILPASFVDPDNATGVVCSVPAHAPYDHMALVDLKNKPEELKKYGLDPKVVKEIKYIPLIKVPGYGDFPAVEICEKTGIKSQNDVQKLEEATGVIYRAEFHKGIYRSEFKEYAGMPVMRAKNAINQELIDRGLGGLMYEFSQKPVRCRCGTECIVKIIHDQWFIDYGNEDWKRISRECLDQMKLIPEERRVQFNNVFDWLDKKACVRLVGLGTKLPWDKKWIIESLSDSTIYMAYYAIAGVINKQKVPASELTDEAFDYMFAGGKPIQNKKVEEMKQEFEYWYPLDYRCSGKDLIPNHLSFFVFNHTAVFERKWWPKAIAVNGYGTLEGQKMSKSKGNVLNWGDAIEKYGADAVRLYIMSLADHVSDFDWKSNEIDHLSKQVSNLVANFDKILEMKESKSSRCDAWLMHRLNIAIKGATEALDEFRTRTAILYCFYNLLNDLRWYLRRTAGNREALSKFLKVWLQLLAPFMPHLAEEYWAKIGEKGFVSLSEWPKAEEGKVDEKLDLGETLVQNIEQDISEVLKLIGKKPKKIYIYTAPEWKHEIYKLITSDKTKAVKLVGEIMKEEKYRKLGKDCISYCQSLAKKVGKLQENVLDSKTELEVLKDAKGFLSSAFECEVVTESAEKPSYDPHGKAKGADVFKPAIYIE